jgi:phage shock protein PspC (stress-responsive transcriptional regulator)
LYRKERGKILAGVCAGLGDYFNIDPTLIRLFVIFLSIFTLLFPVVLAYLIAVLIIPKNPKESFAARGKYRRLYRSRKDRKIAGICGGIAEITKMDPVFLRLLMIFLCALTGFVPVILAYLIGWMIIPESPN